MVKCTAPVRGHKSMKAEAECQACRIRMNQVRYRAPVSTPVVPAAKTYSTRKGSRNPVVAEKKSWWQRLLAQLERLVTR